MTNIHHENASLRQQFKKVIILREDQVWVKAICTVGVQMKGDWLSLIWMSGFDKCLCL